MVHFSTAELWENRADDDLKSTLANQTLEEIKATWKKNFTANTGINNIQELQNRRKEYLSWRLMSKCLLPTKKSILELPKEKKIQPELIKIQSFASCPTCPVNIEDEQDPSGYFNSFDDPTWTSSIPLESFSLSPSFSSSSLLPDSESMIPRHKLPSPVSSGSLSRSSMRSFLNLSVLIEDSDIICNNGKKILSPSHKLSSPSHKLSSPSSRQNFPSPPSGISSIGRIDSTSKLNKSNKTIGNRPKFGRPGGMLGKGTINLEFADYGTGDFRSPSFLALDLREEKRRFSIQENPFNSRESEGPTSDEKEDQSCSGTSSLYGMGSSYSSTITPLRYKSHVIFEKYRPPMPDNLPGIRPIPASTSDTDNSKYSNHPCSTLIVTLSDDVSEIEVDLIYVVMHHFDVITRRTVFRNPAMCSPKMILKATSMTLDLESMSLPFQIMKLSGSWGRERSVVESPITSGMHSFGSLRGVSGHVHNPFIALSVGPFSEDTGEVLAFSLMYSGNFLIEAEVCESGRLRLNVGVNPILQWHLKPGHSFSTPECILVRSDKGIGGISREMHRLTREHILPPLPNWASKNPPILLNTWEVCYFNVSDEKILQMAKEASKIGIDMIVIDDGWFGNREDISSSLGDWVPNKIKFPRGLGPLSNDLNAMGIRLGLWIEPEMASLNSNLLREHPEFYLGMPELPKSVGRNQMVLDMSRAEVQKYLFDSVSKLLSTANIDYIKWDMNRPLTEVFSSRFVPSPGYSLHTIGPAVDFFEEELVWQSETSHRYMLGVYELLSKIRTEFPDLLIETCASGGGRFDLGMLYYSHQIWCSDNTDAIARMKIQYGTSIPYPLRCIGAHISTAPNHITGNVTRLRTRGFVAMSGTFGFEMDLGSLTLDEKELCKKQIKIYKSIAPLIWDGDFYRLWDPFKSNVAAWMSVSGDKSKAVVFAFSLNSDHWSNLVPRLMLRGLLPDAEYEVSEPIPNNGIVKQQY